ncbi:hypothetical protein AB3N59_14905 [Leptospira sp. WS92.C1]
MKYKFEIIQTISFGVLLFILLAGQDCKSVDERYAVVPLSAEDPPQRPCFQIIEYGQTCSCMYIQRYYKSRIGAYLASRVKDFAEIFTLTINTNEYGARAIVGPLSLGLHMQPEKSYNPDEILGRIPDTTTSSFGLQGGLIGPKDNSNFTILFFTFESSQSSVNSSCGYSRKSKEVEKSNLFSPGFNFKPFELSRLGVSAGLYLGLRAEVNPVELLDFFLGFFGIDIYKDDIESASHYDEEVVKHQATFDLICSKDKVKVSSDQEGIYNVTACDQKAVYHCSEVGFHDRYIKCIQKE